MREAAAPPTATPTGRRAWLLLFVLSGNMVLDSIEGSVVLLAVPAISDRFGLPLSTAQWLLSGFALGFAAAIVWGPAMTARWGRRPVYLGAMAVFTLASLAGGLTSSVGVLIAARVLKGCCVALTAPAGLALISTAFPDGPRQRRATSIYSLFGAAGFTVGLLLSGSLTPVDWRWTFLAPAAVALVLLLIGPRVIPRATAPRAPRVTGEILRNAPLLRSTFGAAGLNGCYIGLLLVVSHQLSTRFGWSPWPIALCLLPACVPLVLSVPFAGRLVARFGTTRLIAAGAACALAGEILYALRPAPVPYLPGLLPALLLVEAGLVLSFAALNMQSTAGLPVPLRPAAAPIYQTGVQLGAASMLVLGAVLISRTGDYRPALVLVAAIGAAVLAVAVAGLRGSPERKVRP